LPVINEEKIFWSCLDIIKLLYVPTYTTYSKTFLFLDSLYPVSEAKKGKSMLVLKFAKGYTRKGEERLPCRSLIQPQQTH